MLVLSRKPGEKLVIDSHITITVVEVVGNRVRIGIEAPADVRILRGELAEWHEPQQQPAADLPSRPTKPRTPRRLPRPVRKPCLSR